MVFLFVTVSLFGHRNYYSNQDSSGKCFSFFKTIDFFFLEIASKQLKTISKALAKPQKFQYQRICSLQSLCPQQFLIFFSWSGFPLHILCFSSPVLIELLHYVRRVPLSEVSYERWAQVSEPENRRRIKEGKQISYDTREQIGKVLIQIVYSAHQYSDSFWID